MRSLSRIVGFFWFLCLGTVSAGEVSDDWAFRPLRAVPVPAVSTGTPVDAFVNQELAKHGLTLSPEVDRVTLIRRVTFDLIGLPPTIAEIDQFVKDRSPDAFVKLVDRLLASPRYGERQATAWLDLVRFAESDGFKADDPRPTAWRYRDYVIRSFNSDKPYDRFIREQLAGDEFWPADPDAIIGTGFLRHFPDEFNAVNLEQRRQEILNDITDTTASVFLGVTLGCARCHDHKFDPLKQTDYYRIQAFFAGYRPVDVPIGAPEKVAEFTRRQQQWDSATAELRRKMAELEKPFHEKEQKRQRQRFPKEYADLLDIPAEKRSPLQQQIAAMIEKQVYSNKDVSKSMKGAVKEQWDGMARQMAELAKQKPAPLPTAMAMSEVGPSAPVTRLLSRGDWRHPGPEVKPGFLSAIDDRDAPIVAGAGRRRALADWIASPKNPLTARVIVNRVWQSHFGRGIVGTPSDFGAQGDKPTHPELLDWLAGSFVESGWSLKKLHRLIVTSAVYRQNGRYRPELTQVDPDNRLLGRYPRRRLEGEALRDSALAVAGQLNLKEGGPSVYPELPEELKKSAKNWPVSGTVEERNRRSVYVAVRRNLRYPFLSLFDAPDAAESCSRRFATTTAPQALFMLNDRLVIDLAQHFASRVRRDVGDDPLRQTEQAFRLAFGRHPTPEEQSMARRYLSGLSQAGDGLTDFCHAILNVNEFLFVD
jgi:hypothetical protein